MTMFAERHGDVDEPGFDRQRLSADRIPRVIELTSRLCALNAELPLPTRRAGLGRAGMRDVPDHLARRRRELLDEIHRLISAD
jgi:hypothetical protein